MSSLLPILVSVQSGPHAIDGSVAAAGSLTPVNKDQSTSSGQAFTPAFSQVLHEYNETSLIETSPEEPLPSTNDSSLGLPSTVITSFDGLQAPVRTLFQGSGFQQTGGDSILGLVKQESEISGKNLGIAQIPLPKTLEAGSILYQGSLAKVIESELIPQEIPQGSGIKQASLGVKQEEALPVRPVVPSAKEVPSGFQQVGRTSPRERADSKPYPSQSFQPTGTTSKCAVQSHSSGNSHTGGRPCWIYRTEPDESDFSEINPWEFFRIE